MGGLAIFLAVIAVAGSQPSLVSAAPVDRADGAHAAILRERLLEVEATLGAQREARDRQADAFDAAVARIEFVNGFLVVVLALAGIGGSLLAIRWVRSLAREQVAEQIPSAVGELGREIFEKDSTALCAKYDDLFADLYRQYHELVEAEQ